MSDSHIHRALEEFKAKYAWDKSLLGKRALAPDALGTQDLRDYSIRDFLQSAQAKASEHLSRESS